MRASFQYGDARGLARSRPGHVSDPLPPWLTLGRHGARQGGCSQRWWRADDSMIQLMDAGDAALSAAFPRGVLVEPPPPASPSSSRKPRLGADATALGTSIVPGKCERALTVKPLPHVTPKMAPKLPAPVCTAAPCGKGDAATSSRQLWARSLDGREGGKGSRRKPPASLSCVLWVEGTVCFQGESRRGAASRPHPRAGPGYPELRRWPRRPPPQPFCGIVAQSRLAPGAVATLAAPVPVGGVAVAALPVAVARHHHA